MTLKNDAKFEEELTCRFEIGLEEFDIFWPEHKEFDKFSPEHLKVSEFRLWRDPFIQSRKFIRLKFTEMLCAMTMKNDAKFEEELTCCF